MNKRLLAVAAVLASTTALAACGGGDSGGSGDSAGTLTIAALEGGYGIEMYDEVIAAYEELNPDVTIEFSGSKSIEDELTPKIQAGDVPDLVVLGQGREAALTETFVRDQSLEDVTDVLDRTVPGEDVTVGSKLVDGIVGNLNTNPYGDDKTYLMPMYYAPTGLFYDQGLFEEQGWEVPTTWDEMFALGEQAQAEDVALFTYPTAGYLDGFFNALLATVGGEEFYEEVMTYQPDVWESEDATEALDLTSELLDYAAPTTVGYANEQDFTRNQQSILDREAAFMPNGTWIVNEMAAAPRADGFTWGLTPLPAVEAGGERYITTSVESAWIPSASDNKDAAKDFMAFLYSDTAAEIFAGSDAIQPIQGLADSLEGETKDFYSVYSEEGVRALVGGFAGTTPVPGVDIKSTLYDSANSIISGDLTTEQWQADLNEASNRLQEAAG